MRLPYSRENQRSIIFISIKIKFSVRQQVVPVRGQACYFFLFIERLARHDALVVSLLITQLRNRLNKSRKI